jgi:alpha-L-fucosidase
MKYLLLSLLISVSLFGQDIKPILPIPSAKQLAWQSLEYYGFVHFNMNTFTNAEWGEGKENPNSYNPTALDCEQWARIAKKAGMKGLILTAKHHDGFALYPSKFTKHSVANSSWKNGKGDVVRDLSNACKKYGLKLGIYLSPWDRYHPDYGTDAYNQVYANMQKELLTQYGPIFEFWYDGANGECMTGLYFIRWSRNTNLKQSNFQIQDLIFVGSGMNAVMHMTKHGVRLIGMKFIPDIPSLMYIKMGKKMEVIGLPLK